MNLSDEEFLSLSGQMSDRDVKIATLENKVEQLEGDLLVARAEEIMGSVLLIIFKWVGGRFLLWQATLSVTLFR